MRPTHVCFLDVDGVLNCVNGPVVRGLFGICWQRVGLLNQICERTGAVVVVSSTWRLNRTVAQLRELFVEHGFTGVVFDKTPDLTRSMVGSQLVVASERGDEIADWLSRHPHVTHFAILDDDSDMSTVASHLVQTSWEHGLQPEHVDRVVEILSRPREGLAA